LLDNACKWARSAVCLQAQTNTLSGSLRQFSVWVEDDGPGIGAAQRTQAVERGVRLDETVTGSGLGLAIVHELASMYGGRLELEPAALGGLRAVLTLPAASETA
jgi:signal transduction histidine kinase